MHHIETIKGQYKKLYFVVKKNINCIEWNKSIHPDSFTKYNQNKIYNLKSKSLLFLYKLDNENNFKGKDQGFDGWIQVH